MRKLTKRTDIASAVNLKMYPTVVVDVSDRDDYGIKGTNVCIETDGIGPGEKHYIRGRLRTYRDKNKLCFAAYGVCLSNSMSYYDYEKMYEYANAPIIKPDQEILVCLVDREKKVAYEPVVLRTGKTVSRHCTTPLDLEEFEVL